MMLLHTQKLEIATHGRRTYDITNEVQRVVRESKIKVGMCTVFVHHTSCSLIISENADAAVHRDLDAFMARLVPDGDPLYLHVEEGPDDMPSHVRSVLTQTSLNV